MIKKDHHLQEHLRKAGFKSAIVPIHRLIDLKVEMEGLLKEHQFNNDFIEEHLSRFSFEIPIDLPSAKSIIITAVQQPKVRVKFKLNRKIYPVIIPPIYSYESDQIAIKIFSKFLVKYGYQIRDAVIPEKSLAVHVRLAYYGRNNIAYIEDWGSYFRLKAYFSDLSPEDDNWNDFALTDNCKKCTACVGACPTKAIRDDDFIIRAERCLTFFNEGLDEFPEWIEPQWHNCLIGCMICQEVCPLNMQYKNSLDDGGEFTEWETQMILEGIPSHRLPIKTKSLLKKLGMLEDYGVLQRNLSVLIFHKF
jgi:epoxyqueuosine reductase